MRAIALIDGEHYPPVVRSALASIAAEFDLVGAAFIGGTEKVASVASDQTYGLPVSSGEDAAAALEDAIRRFSPEIAIDLSDEPVLSAADRMALASVALAHGVTYRGADFVFAPRTGLVATRTPTLAVIGTGKRVGKTGVSAFVARYLKDMGRDIVVLAMGRGGPAEPELIHGDQVALTTEDLVSLARSGVHAASDSYEDAVMSRVTTVGCHRCGGGLAGATYLSNVGEGARLADSLGKDLMILEGSGAAIPPVVADATLLVVGAQQGPAYVRDFFGPYRTRLADAIVITGAEEPLATEAQVADLTTAIRELDAEIPVVPVIFRPKPLQDVAGMRVFFATTACAELLPLLVEHLEAEYGCTVAAASPHLSDRARLRQDMAEAEGTFDVFLTELKAAAIDVVATAGAESGVPTVLCDNEPLALAADGLAPAIDLLVRLSAERHASRSV